MKTAVVTICTVALMVLATCMLRVAFGQGEEEFPVSQLGQAQGNVENIRFAAEPAESAELAETIANLIIAHGLGDRFDNIFINTNKGDEVIPPILILKLLGGVKTSPFKGDETFEKMIKEVTFLMSRQYKDQQVEVWVQDSEYTNLLKAFYDPEKHEVAFIWKESE